MLCSACLATFPGPDVSDISDDASDASDAPEFSIGLCELCANQLSEIEKNASFQTPAEGGDQAAEAEIDIEIERNGYSGAAEDSSSMNQAAIKDAWEIIWDTMDSGTDEGALERLQDLLATSDGTQYAIEQTGSSRYGELTLFHWSARWGRSKCVRQLHATMVFAGMDVDVKTSNGETALDLAIRFSKKDVKEFLLRAQQTKTSRKPDTPEEADQAEEAGEAEEADIDIEIQRATSSGAAAEQDIQAVDAEINIEYDRSKLYASAIEEFSAKVNALQTGCKGSNGVQESVGSETPVEGNRETKSSKKKKKKKRSKGPKGPK